jgi:hypothetical protein
LLALLFLECDSWSIVMVAVDVKERWEFPAFGVISPKAGEE